MASYLSRGGKNVEADEAFFAWTSQDLPRMLRACSVATNPVDRHFLLVGIVGANIRWLVEHTASHEEIDSLLAIAARDLDDATAEGLSDDWRHIIAYNTALQPATVALAAAG